MPANINTTKRGSVLTFCLLPMLLSSAMAAQIAVSLSPVADAIPDPNYPGFFMGEASSPSTGFTVSLSGVNYGLDSEFPDLVWGLGADRLPGRRRTYWVVDNGFEPMRAGSIQYDASGMGASYISVKVDTHGEDSVFQGMTIEFKGIADMATTNGWFGTTGDNFAMAGQFSLRDSDQSLTVTIPTFTHRGSEPAEIRLYGLRGADIGGFTLLDVKGSVVPAPPLPVPEPGTVLLLTTVAAGVMLRRRRVAR